MSHNTLKFAMHAKKIQQYARITEVVDEKTLLRSYREEIEELKWQLKEAKVVAAEAVQESQQVQLPVVQNTPRCSRGSSSSLDEEDQDDTHVLVSAIANLELLILKASSKSTRNVNPVQNDSSNNGIATGEADEGVAINRSSLLPSRSLNTALMKAESSQSPIDTT